MLSSIKLLIVKKKSASDISWRIFLSSISGVMVKVVSGLFAFFSVRMILLYLGSEKYGLWMTITSFVGLLGFMDLGFGNQLMNNIARAQGDNDQEKIRHQIAIACVSLTFIVSGFFVCFLTSFYFVPWQKILATPSHLESDLYTTLLIVGVSFASTLLLNLISVIQRGLQRGYFANTWELGRVISSFLFLWLAIKNDLGMYWIAIAVFALPLCFTVCNWIWFFKKYQTFFPRRWNVKWADVRVFFRQGSLFFYLQVAALIAYQTDSLILAHFADYQSVAEYAIGMKLFMLPSIFTDAYLLSLWPAYANAYGRKDYDWIKKTFSRSIKVCALFLFISALFLFFSTPYILDFWLSGAQKISFALLLTLSVWVFLGAFNSNVSCLLNALNIAKPQAIIVAVVLVLNLIFSIYLVQRIGVSGVLLGTILSLLIGGLIPYTLLIKKIFKSLVN